MQSLIRSLQNLSFKVKPVQTIRLLSQITPATSVAPQIVLANAATNNHWIYKEEDAVRSPFINGTSTIRLPNDLYWLPLQKDDTVEKPHIEAPATGNIAEKQAARLIVIRRKKMKKHKLRKLRKRMKFEVAKKRQKRELKKEKAFHAVLIKQYKIAEAFSAEKYVEEKLAKFHELTASQSTQNLYENVTSK